MPLSTATVTSAGSTAVRLDCAASCLAVGRVFRDERLVRRPRRPDASCWMPKAAPPPSTSDADDDERQVARGRRSWTRRDDASFLAAEAWTRSPWPSCSCAGRCAAGRRAPGGAPCRGHVAGRGGGRLRAARRAARRRAPCPAPVGLLRCAVLLVAAAGAGGASRRAAPGTGGALPGCWPGCAGGCPGLRAGLASPGAAAAPAAAAAACWAVAGPTWLRGLLAARASAAPVRAR